MSGGGRLPDDEAADEEAADADADEAAWSGGVSPDAQPATASSSATAPNEDRRRLLIPRG